MTASRRDYWQRQSKRYERRGGKGMFEYFARQELRIAASIYTEYCDTVTGWTLDLGSGSGGLWRIAPLPQKLVLLDLAKPPITMDIPSQQVVADALDPPFRKEKFDSIVALGLLEYLVGLDAALGAWRRVARTGARLLFSNSPPSLPNLARSWLGYHAIVRPDYIVVAAAERQGWQILPDVKRRAGWQTIFLAEAN